MKKIYATDEITEADKIKNLLGKKGFTVIIKKESVIAQSGKPIEILIDDKDDEKKAKKSYLTILIRTSQI